MASGNIDVIPFNGANIQTASGLPSATVQASEATSYPRHEAQQLGTSTSAPQQVSRKNPWQAFFNAEAKVLGAVQIMIGLMHIGFGAVGVNLPSFHCDSTSVTITGGYPIWGGIFFISSGSLCIIAANSQNRCLVESSVGMNITSAIMALIGIVICIVDLAIKKPSSEDQCSYKDYIIKYVADSGLSGLLFLFSLLEFCITVSSMYFWCQSTFCADNQPTLVYVPYQVNRDATVTCEPNQRFSPAYDNVVTRP